MKSKNKANRYEYIEKHHAGLWKFLKTYFETERWDEILSDRKLVDVCMANGHYATASIIRDIRLAHDVGTADSRKVSQYRKHWESINNRTKNGATK